MKTEIQMNRAEKLTIFLKKKGHWKQITWVFIKKKERKMHKRINRLKRIKQILPDEPNTKLSGLKQA